MLAQGVTTAARLRRIAMAALAGIFAGGLSGCATTVPRQPTLPTSPPPLVVERISLTAAGHFVDFRYRVTDVEAARMAFTPQAVYRLTDEQTGQIMLVPTTAKLGALRQTRGLKTGHTYFMLFVNGGLRQGSVVTAEIAGFRFEHLTVQ